MKQAILKFGPAVAWFALIFILTSIPAPGIPEIRIPYFDKIMHFAFYLPFGFFLMRALGPGGLKRILLVVVVCLAAAACDELHQMLVPGRQADALDFSADMAGAALGMLLNRVTGKVRRSGARGAPGGPGDPGARP